jgi:hypothetical protein
LYIEPRGEPEEEDTVKDVKSFDGDLKMFRETPRPVNLERLQFLRWLIEQGRLEHLPAGPPSGPFAEELMAEAV